MADGCEDDGRQDYWFQESAGGQLGQVGIQEELEAHHRPDWHVRLQRTHQATGTS